MDSWWNDIVFSINFGILFFCLMISKRSAFQTRKRHVIHEVRTRKWSKCSAFNAETRFYERRKLVEQKMRLRIGCNSVVCHSHDARASSWFHGSRVLSQQWAHCLTRNGFFSPKFGAEKSALPMAEHQRHTSCTTYAATRKSQCLLRPVQRANWMEVHATHWTAFTYAPIAH